MKVWDLLQQIRNEAEDRDEYALAVWHIDDVYEVAKEQGVEITEDEAKEVIEQTYRRHDASIHQGSCTASRR